MGHLAVRTTIKIKRVTESSSLYGTKQKSDNNQERRKTRRSLRLQIMSIAVVGTLGFFVFLFVMLSASKQRADLLTQIRDTRYPVQENLQAAVHNLKFIDSNVEQAIFSSNIALLDHSMILASEFRSHLHNTMKLDSEKASDLEKILGQFDHYYRNSNKLAQSVIRGEKSNRAITPEKIRNARDFNSIMSALSNLHVKQKESLVTSVNAAANLANEALRVGLTTGLLTAALVFIIALLTTRSILHRINNMVSSLRNIATGTEDMNVRIPLTGSDEMTELAYWFNTFIQKLQHLTTESTAEIKRLAYTDTLTNLPNRRMFLNCLNTEIDRLKNKKNKSLAVMFLDLDNFKPVNDQLGHDAGDELIKVVAQRLADTVRSSDTISTDYTLELASYEPGQAVVARLAGDEFMLIISDLDNAEQATPVATRIRESLTRPITINGMECSVGVSIGICLYPDNAGNADELVTCADMAMYEAKNSGKNTYRFFDPTLRETTDRKIKMDNAIKTAIEKEELHLFFQPKFRLSDRQLVGAEALLRWENEELGTFTPADFIAQAEANGKICEIDDWVLSSVIDQLALWDTQGLAPIDIAINFSAFQASRPDLGTAMERLAADKSHLLSQLEVEITETSAIDNINIVENNIHDLQTHGIKIAMDDFGSGHSSLSLLTRCPINTLKIDKEMTRSVCSDEKSKVIVQSIIELATKLDVAVCAEGIEDEFQAQTLSSMNCNYGQGFLFSEPLSAVQFTHFLAMRDRGMIDKAA